jgi:hypothetical protein
LKTLVKEEISARQSERRYLVIPFPIMFAENAVNFDTSRMIYGQWTSLKDVMF